ncbi:craniofacial development protein 2-like [Aphis craccivora]|uniref:Craniofacial development protein 2-like n=1 Tax=Aphis craccivora TaxID=307492 RepID=A0A6G0YVK8_APHCR|nr:craniofacial development protein 2-like [Aphis craccivora]
MAAPTENKQKDEKEAFYEDLNTIYEINTQESYEDYPRRFQLKSSTENQIYHIITDLEISNIIKDIGSYWGVSAQSDHLLVK